MKQEETELIQTPNLINDPIKFGGKKKTRRKSFSDSFQLSGLSVQEIYNENC